MKILLLFCLILTVSCTTVKKKRVLTTKDQALIKSVPIQSWADDLDYEGLAEGLLANMQHLRTKPEHTLQFAQFKVNSLDYANSLEGLYSALLESKENYLNYLQTHFSVYEVFGKNKPGEAFVTSYFAPEIKGSLTKTQKFTEPLYELPKDMVIVRLDEFTRTYGDRFFKRFCSDKSNCQAPGKLGILRSRRVKKEGAADEIWPYYSRAQIHEKNLDAKVLAWVDPIDAFFLQIQGSGFVMLEGHKKLRVGYAGQNGHRYEAIGKYLFDVIPKEKMSLQTIEKHLQTLSQSDLQNLLNKNPSYVFFKEIDTKPVTYFGIETIDGRTIATDKRYFPKGALAFLKFKKPIFKSESASEPESWQQVSRFVFDHDTGGAIKGGGRLDLFWGAGGEAKQSAGVIKHLGELYYLLPKSVENNSIEPLAKKGSE